MSYTRPGSPFLYDETTHDIVGIKDRDGGENLSLVSGGGGGGSTNLSYTASPTQGIVVSDSGNDATLPAADGTNAGLMLPDQVAKLAGVATGATANSTDAALLDRANHTGTQLSATISDFPEATQDVIGAMVVAAGGSYDDAAGTVTFPGGGSTPAPQAFTTRALVSGDANVTFTLSTAQTVTINSGLGTGFGCRFVGAGALTVSAGTATVTDFRTTGAANPACELIQIGTETYGVYGGKA